METTPKNRNCMHEKLRASQILAMLANIIVMCDLS